MSGGMEWLDKMSRQPGGDGPREIELSAEFICAMAGPSFFEPLRAPGIEPLRNSTARGVAAKSRKAR